MWISAFLRTIAEQSRDRLLQDENLTQVELTSEPDHEIEVNVNPDQLRRYNLTLNEIAKALDNSAFDQTSGEITASGGDISIRVQERRNQANEFLDIPVKTLSEGSSVLLRDVATVTPALDDEGREFRYNGSLSAAITVYRIGDQTPISVSDSVRDILPQIEAELPPGVQMAITEDDSADYRNQMNLLLENAFIGLALVLVLLSIFLEYRLAFWVTMGIPTSFLGAMLLLPSMDVSINIISMFAFIIALGIVVDDAIIAG